MDTIGFIGGGNMAEALIKGIIKAKLYQPQQIHVSDIKSERLNYLNENYNVQIHNDNSEVAINSSILILSVKPQNMTEALDSIKDSIKPDTLVISIAGGIKTEKIKAKLPNSPVIRTMPNTPAIITQGATAIFAASGAKSHIKKAVSIFSSVGKTIVLDDEALLDAVTAVSGSGPAYFFLLMEELISAAVDIGLPALIASELVLQTAKGAALLAESTANENQTPKDLRQKVTSPNGTTEAALKVFSEYNFSQLISKAVKKAQQRSFELSA